jgi:hypothetical protein
VIKSISEEPVASLCSVLLSQVKMYVYKEWPFGRGKGEVLKATTCKEDPEMGNMQERP